MIDTVDGAAAGRTPVRSIALLSAAAFCSAASMRVADPLLPQIAEEFAVTPGIASVVVTSFALAYGLCQVVFGPIGDRLGKFRVIAVTTTLSAAVVMLGAAAGSLAALAWLRLAAGIAAGAIIPLAIAYVGDVVPYEHRQTVLARFLSGQILGLIFGQAIGGVLIEHASWRAAFVVLAAGFGLVAAALWVELRSGRAVDRHSSVRISIAGILRQHAALLGSARARATVMAVAIEGAVFFGGFAYLGAYMRQGFGLDYASVGLLLACFGLGGLAYSLMVRRIVAALGERGMVRCGGGLLALSFAVLAVGPVWWLLGPITGVIGLGFYMLHNTLQTNATQMAPEARGSAVSLFALCFFLGQAVGVAAIGALVDRAGYAAAFILVGISLLALGLWFAGRITWSR